MAEAKCTIENWPATGYYGTPDFAPFGASPVSELPQMSKVEMVDGIAEMEKGAYYIFERNTSPPQYKIYVHPPDVSNRAKISNVTRIWKVKWPKPVNNFDIVLEFEEK